MRSLPQASRCNALRPVGTLEGSVARRVFNRPYGTRWLSAELRRVCALYILLEYEEGGDPREECPRYIEKLKEVFA